MMKLFEVSWEVANKVGGIYTVVSSKAHYMKEKFSEYYCIGPNFESSDFEERIVPEEFEEVFARCEKRGVKCKFGHWVGGKAKTILIDSSELFKFKDNIKKELWESFGIDSLFSGYDFEEPVIWSWGVGIFLEEYKRFFDDEVLGQFHEWLSGAGILYLKKNNIDVKTVFTTHATVLERALASKGKLFFNGIDSDKKAYELNVHDKHQIEKQSVLNSGVFSCVSSNVAENSEKIFGRKCDFVVLNGMDLKNFPDMEEIPEFHKRNKERLKDFTMAYFYPYYYFDIEETLFYFISGRYEVHAKGIDVFIKSLGRLNERLKKEDSKKNVVAFIFIPGEKTKEDSRIIESLIFLKNMKAKVEEHLDSLKDNVLHNFLGDEEKELISENFKERMKRLNNIFKRQGNPPLATNYVKDSDVILNLIKESGLRNNVEDKVKIIYYPNYLEENDGLLDLNYYDATSGCHLGVFPSFYEPWGYTPVESAALGVPAITTDLAGFGRYVSENLKIKSPDEKGILVLKRRGKNDTEFEMELEDSMYWYLKLPKIIRIKNKILAESFVSRVSWDKLIENYVKAYDMARGK